MLPASQEGFGAAMFYVIAYALMSAAAFGVLILLSGEGAEAESLEQALSLYRGAFLEDLSLPDSALFEEWRILKREQLQREVLDVLSRLVAGYERQGEYERALAAGVGIEKKMIST